MKKTKSKSTHLNKFTDARTGLRASIDSNGYLRMFNVPIMKCGKLKQKLSTFEGLNREAITEQDRDRGWAWALRPAKEVFSKKTMTSFVGIPVLYRGDAGPYILCTACERYNPLTEEPPANRPIGTVLAVRKGRRGMKDWIMADIIIWNVHALAQSIEGGYVKGLAATTVIKNVVIRENGVRIKQVNLRPNSLYLSWGTIFGVYILEKQSKFHTWFAKRYIHAPSNRMDMPTT